MACYTKPVHQPNEEEVTSECLPSSPTSRAGTHSSLRDPLLAGTMLLGICQFETNAQGQVDYLDTW